MAPACGSSPTALHHPRRGSTKWSAARGGALLLLPFLAIALGGVLPLAGAPKCLPTHKNPIFVIPGGAVLSDGPAAAEGRAPAASAPATKRQRARLPAIHGHGRAPPPLLALRWRAGPATFL